MKRLKIALFIIISLAIAQPVLAAGVGGKMTPPAASISIDTEEKNLLEWIADWF